MVSEKTLWVFAFCHHPSQRLALSTRIDVLPVAARPQPSQPAHGKPPLNFDRVELVMLFDALQFSSGPMMANRFMLAPLTNQQSHDDGTLSDDEFHWLTMRAKGGFGMTMTCGVYVRDEGKGFDGQLGLTKNAHLDGQRRFAKGIKDAGSMAIMQLIHGGLRALQPVAGGQALAPSDDDRKGARAMTLDDVHKTREGFIQAALWAEEAGYDGVELHGAHGYLLCQFISPTINQRDDEYGGSLENRSRLLGEIIDGIRARCRPDFVLGVRLSPERFGMKLAEIKSLYTDLCASGKIDFMDMSLWDVFKEPEEDAFKGKTLLAHFAEIARHDTKLTVAGKITSGADVAAVMAAGVDFVAIGRAAILHHDLPKQIAASPQFQPIPLPASRAHLAAEGLSPKFITYMGNWKGFVDGDGA
jgi:2,4-dienoyl-CoA reductase-like NADH-dependent reductase (Old Yellow Enzyme family)